MEVLYHIRPYFGRIAPYIGLKNRPYINGIGTFNQSDPEDLPLKHVDEWQMRETLVGVGYELDEFCWFFLLSRLVTREMGPWGQN